MSWSKITLLGFYDWKKSHGDNLFNNLTLPDGISKDTVIGNILLEGGEFEVLYANPDYMQLQIGLWAQKNYRTFEKWIIALNKEYEPLWNLDVTEEWTDTGDKDRTLARGVNDTTTKTGGYTTKDVFTGQEVVAEDETDTNNLTRTDALKTTVDAGSTTENLRSAFDSASYQPHDKQTVDSDSTTDNTGTVKNTGTVVSDRDQTTSTDNIDTVTNTNNDKIDDVLSENMTEGINDVNEHYGHRYGNQGVTMSQDMLAKELEIARWNIYEHITDMFITEFCIPVYE